MSGFKLMLLGLLVVWAVTFYLVHGNAVLFYLFIHTTIVGVWAFLMGLAMEYGNKKHP